ncbi:uncharacterized protein B0H18DRAFT_1117621 [Fomitopsis serialis]|uniref:uncharacterized protein n=1 Tax=Fomitopsis serialis TaxID=139415 RepID=UPI0020084866|nr:uncharacterized protein B0H18DRAFT_1117621 [Neoantrodia serialis]KAH9929281.1 hypothetical protein B0H18DRAFT_1117621 [Neoantrodia serialis]
MPLEYHKFRQAVDEQWDLTRILTEFVFMEIRLDKESTDLMPIVSPQLSPPDAVRRIKEHLSRLFVLMYNLLAAVNDREGDVQQRAALHRFRGIKEPGNKVLLTIAKEDLQGYSTTLPSLDPGTPAADMVLHMQHNFSSAFDVFTDRLPANALSYALSGCRKRMRKAVLEEQMKEKHARNKEQAKAQGKRVRPRHTAKASANTSTNTKVKGAGNAKAQGKRAGRNAPIEPEGIITYTDRNTAQGNAVTRELGIAGSDGDIQSPVCPDESSMDMSDMAVDACNTTAETQAAPLAPGAVATSQEHSSLPDGQPEHTSIIEEKDQFFEWKKSGRSILEVSNRSTGRPQ